MRLKHFILITFSSLLYAAALPNELFTWGNPFFGFVALVPFFYTLYSAKSIKNAMLYGAYFGFLSTGLIYFWLLFFQDFSLWTLSGVVFAHILFFMILGPFLHTAGKYPSFIRPLVTAGIWIVYEYLKSIGYLALPWGLLAHTEGTFLPLIQISDVTGQWGVSFLVALANAVILESIIILPAGNFYQKASLKRLSLFTGFLFVLTFLYGEYTLHTPIPVTTTFNAVLVQQNADSWITGNEMKSILEGQILTKEALSRSKRKPDIVIWSENAFRYPYTEGSIRYRNFPKTDPFISFLKEIDTPVLVGSPYILDPKTYTALNAVMLISPQGKILTYYGKTHPVPFAENIPFWNIPFVQSFFRKVLGLDSEGWAIGKPNILFSFRNKKGTQIRFGSPICFEDSFPGIARSFFLHGADLLINLSNDSWSKTISGETQHYMAAKFRAIENRRTLVRSTNAGVTAVIDPYGREHNMLPLFVSQAENVTVPVYKKKHFTFYTRFGNWFPLLVFMILVTGHFFLLKKKLFHGFSNTF